MQFLHIVEALVAGALITSLAEYLFGYNLVDYLKDLVLHLLGKKA